jgi:demethylspheroidene O-methyltransferase
LVIAEPLAETPGAESIGHTYFGIYLWAMGSGRPRTRAELTQFLAAAGFKNIEERPSAMPCLVRVLTAIPNKA